MPINNNGFSVEGLVNSLVGAKQQKNIKEILLCGPHNPLGYVTSKKTWEVVADVLSNY